MNAGQRANLYGLERPELREVLEELGEPAFHGDQAYRWMYRRGVADPAGWTDLSLDLRRRLGDRFTVDLGRIERTSEAADGTVKYRVKLPDGEHVESVFMVADERITLCISSQVGCALDCAFCLTGRMGLRRQLTAGEIVGQVALLVTDRDLEGTRFNLVFMGMGEPLHNYDEATAAVRVLCDPDGFGLSRQRITVSTVGLVPAIRKLAGEAVRPRLAVSLNATDDDTRSSLMPINRKYPIEDLLLACRDYTRTTGDRLTFEYVLLAGVNDSDDDVRRLCRILGTHRAKLNLIPFNAVPGWLPYRPPSEARVLRIRDRILEDGHRVSIRWSRGREARAACGQLALLPDEPTTEVSTS
jgi:23S rRNA (adenine2503-C2)-methyltransferase